MASDIKGQLNMSLGEESAAQVIADVQEWLWALFFLVAKRGLLFKAEREKQVKRNWIWRRWRQTDQSMKYKDKNFD